MQDTLPEPNTPLRVVFFVGRLTVGGAERVTSTLLTNLNRRNFAPELALVRDRIEYDLPPDVRVRCLEREHGLWPVAKTVQTIGWLRRWLAADPPDVVVSMFSHYNLPTGSAIASSRQNVAWIARVANSPTKIEAGPHALWARMVYPWARCIIANSAGLADGFRQHHRSPAWPVLHVPNPLDLEYVYRSAAEEPKFSLPASPIVVAAGRLAPQKRYDVMLQAFGRISSHTGAHLVILGDGPQRTALQELITKLGLSDRVTLAGFHNNPHPIIARASLFLLTSDYEGSPNALLEAQALGIPAVSTQCPFGPDEIIDDGTTGYLAACGDADAIADGALRVLTAPDGGRAMGSSARERISARFGLATTLPAWERTLHQAATGSQSSPLT